MRRLADEAEDFLEPMALDRDLEESIDNEFLEPEDVSGLEPESRDTDSSSTASVDVSKVPW